MQGLKHILFLFASLISVSVLTAQTFPVDTIVYHGNPNKFINIIFLGDGFTDSEQGAYLQEVQDVSDYLFNTSPFKEYQKYFNVFAISVPSAQSGTDHPGTATDVTEPVFPVESVNTYFNSTFDAGNIHRLLVAANGSAINNVLIQNFPLYDQVLILVNSPNYGGSGGSRAVGSLHASAAEIMLHEMGHSFGGLADEYYAGDQYANERANMTRETNPNLVRWKNWMDDFGIGIFQHCCGGNSAEWYRPHQGCKMRALGTQYPFCSVCTETMIERIHHLFGTPVTAYEPNQSVVSACGNPIEFVLQTVAPIPNTLSIIWTLNGDDIEFNKDSVTITGSALNPGSNTLSVTITDDTELSRKDDHPSNHTYSVTWTINYELVPEPVITPDGPTSFCAGASVTLTCDPANAYEWSTGETIQSINTGESGTYEVTITNAYGCSATSLPVYVEILPVPEAFIIEGEVVSICPGESTTLTAGPADTYYWNTGETTQSIVVTGPGSYVVTVENSEGCQNVSEPTTVELFTSADAAITPGGEISGCQGDTITLTAGAGDVYVWNTGETTQEILVTESGVFMVTVTNAFECTAVSDPVVVDMYPRPVALITPDGVLRFCAGDSVILLVNEATEYLWNTGDTTQTIHISTSGTYQVTITDAFGCADASPAVHVEVTPLPDPAIFADGPTEFCAGDSVTLTTGLFTSYAWNTGDTTQSIVVPASGSYTVIVTDQYGCSASSAVPVVVFALPPVPEIIAADNILMSSAKSGNQWYFNDSLLIGSTGQSLTAFETGFYTVAMTDSNGCTVFSEPLQVVLTGVANLNDDSRIIIIPNPSRGVFRIFIGDTADAQITIFDAAGKQVFRTDVYMPEIDLSAQPKGAYAVVIQTHNLTYRRIVLIQ